MSIIIRLQNLPLSAKSGDVRHFFGGLCIPDGGVHIVGGEKGDAFIAFNSDEDARLAIRKDRGKLMGVRVRLYLSSHMEMQHEIERIRKKYSDASHGRLSPFERSRTSPRKRERSIDRHYYKSNSPSKNRTTTYQVTKELSPHSRKSSRLRSRSPRMRSRSPMLRSRSTRLKSRSSRRSRSRDRRSKSPRMRSRSPRLRSRSPFNKSPLSLNLQRSISPTPRSFPLHKNKSVSSYENESSNYVHKFYSSQDISHTDMYNDSKEIKHNDFSKMERKEKTTPSWLDKDFFLRNEQAELEKKITEALKTGIDNLKKGTFYNHLPSTVESSIDPNLIPYKQEYVNPSLDRVLHDNSHPFVSSDSNINKDADIIKSFTSNINYFNPPINTEGISTHLPPPPPAPMISVPLPVPMISMSPMTVPPPIQMPVMPPPLPVVAMPPLGPPSAMLPPAPALQTNTFIPSPGFYITISGLDINWNFSEVQEMLKGTFVPMKNIKWEIDDHGMKTGTAFVKLLNKEDFDELLSHATYVFNSRTITVSECPSHVVHRYFLPEWPLKGQAGVSDNSNLYYRIKGLPYIASYKDLIEFFQGFELTDAYIEHDSLGKATGIGYVAFGNNQDYQEAFKMNGKKIGHRCVYLMVSTKKALMRLKELKGDLLRQSKVLRPSTVTNNPLSDVSSAVQRRPLCALLTGLPQDITPSKIKYFFKDAGLEPNAVHITLNDKGRPNSRAFAEFNNVRAFDSALKCHGTTFEGKIICVKQILFDEMSQILSTQRTMQVYGTRTESSLNDESEKLPHIWQPPDAAQDKLEQLSNFTSTNVNFGGITFDRERKNKSMIEVFHYKDSSREPTTVQYIPKTSNFFPPSKSYEFSHGSVQHHENLSNKKGTFQNEKWHSPKSSFGSKEMDKTFTSAKLIDSGRSVRDSFTARMDDANSNRIPVKFEMKTKQSNVNKNEVDEAFAKDLKHDDKKKITKLSPEKSPVPPSNVNLDGNSLDKKASKKEDDADISFKGKSLNYRKKNKKAKGRYKRNDDHFFQPSEELYSRDPRSERYGFGMEYDESSETVVQIGNVDPVLEGIDLEDFFRGFDIDHNKITRRTVEGEPTWDIRVTFRSYREATRAIRMLNGTFLNGIPIDMFIIN
ncbi:hypothetical protein TNCT_194491 [Trichonephila clavata]|uniref:RRM domain-containing protein n=1 Tax=Trichonephila clavata TaxID=2740835 RepID=A0A8X6EYW6_TRICU|nr:hypothetical protein TNCT_194491 [Trichonephila clavata]